MAKEKRKIVSAIAVCLLISCILATSAMALTTDSTATINVGSTYVEAAHKDLNTNRLYGRVKSISGNSGAQLYGGMWTFRIFGPYERGYAYVGVDETSSTYYWDPNGTGYYYAIAYAADHNHNGDSKAWQSGH